MHHTSAQPSGSQTKPSTNWMMPFSAGTSASTMVAPPTGTRPLSRLTSMSPASDPIGPESGRLDLAAHLVRDWPMLAVGVCGELCNADPVKLVVERTVDEATELSFAYDAAGLGDTPLVEGQRHLLWVPYENPTLSRISVNRKRSSVT